MRPRLSCILIALGLLAGLLGAAPARAQQVGRSEAATTEQRLAEDVGFTTRNALPVPELTNLQNLAEIVQRGNGNRASSSQINPGSTANQAYIMQVGSLNEAALTQRGSGNVTRLQQDGAGNSATSTVTGDNNNTDLRQQGDGNRVVREVTTNGATFNLLQQGNDNALTQKGAELLAPPKYGVEMRGNGIRLTIETGKVGQ